MSSIAKKRFRVLLLAICFVLSKAAFAKIVSTSDIQVIESEIKTADKSTLVIFDVQNVLLQPKDQLLKKQNRHHLEKFRKQLKARLGSKEYQELYSLILLQRNTEAVNNKFVQLIRQVQKKDIKTLALTNCRTGQFGKIASMEQKRLYELMNAGYHFHRSWPLIKEQVFHQLFSESSNCSPTFRKGVIFTCRTAKGPALQAFLNYVAFNPRRIIFVDDQMKNIKSVEKIAKCMDISFLGIEYLIPKNDKLPLEALERAKLQFYILEKEHHWISDREADFRIKQLVKTPTFNVNYK